MELLRVLFVRYIGNFLKLLAAAILSSSLIPVCAQFTVDNWMTDKGLPQVSVYSIVQTRDNYLWLATLDGLVRFDGVRFKVFNKSNSPGIISNRFFSLFEDAAGDLWASTEQNGLVRLHKGEFTSYGLESGLTSLRNIWLSGDADGNLVVYPPRLNGIVRWTGQRFEPFESSLRDELPSSPVEMICRDQEVKFDCYGGGSRYTFTPGADWTSRSRSGDHFRMIADGRGSAWIETLKGGLVRIDKSGIVQAELPGKVLGSVTGGGTGYLWVDSNGALGLTRTSTMAPQRLVDKAPSEILEVGEFLSTLEDREGNIWVGSTRSGLSLIRRQFISSLSTESGLTDNNIYPIFQDRYGTIWAGTNRGIFKYENGKFKRIEEAPAASVNAIGEDSEGRLIFACEGLRTLRDGTAPIIPDYKAVLTRVYVIHTSVDGSLWIGGQGGVVRIKDGVQELYSSKNGLAGDDVKAITDDSHGGVWIGAYGGLSHFSDGILKRWTQSDGLPSETIRSLHQDAEGTLWIGSYDAGLARFKDGKFTTITMSAGLFNDGAFQILEDDRDNFWISSNQGVYRVQKNDLNRYSDGQTPTVTPIAYGISDGMKNVECNGGRAPAGIKTREGTLWFPTQDGIAVIDPQNIVANSNPPPVVIEEVRVDNKSIGPAALIAVLDGANEGLTIEPDQTNFEVEYTALSFINSKNSRFKYRLEGLEPNWIDAGTRRTAYYSYVPPGTYTFRVIAANSDGIWNDVGTAMTVRVIPPFYRRWWFVLLAASVLILLGIALYRQRIEKFKEQGRRQEEFSRRLLASQEEERQRIAAAMHDTLGQSLLIIKNRVAIAQDNIGSTETVEEQLAELSDSASAAIDECREIAYNLRPFQIGRFGLTKTLGAIFGNIGEVTQIEVETDIANIDGLLSEEAEIGIFRIVQECANNIIKHSQATSASIVVTRLDRGIKLVIKDDGVGFDPVEVDRHRQTMGRFGLVGIAERVKMLGGTINIQSVTGQGTELIVSLDGLKFNV